MIRKGKCVQNCGCISSTPVNTNLTTIRTGILSLGAEPMWEIKKIREFSKEFKSH